MKKIYYVIVLICISVMMVNCGDSNRTEQEDPKPVKVKQVYVPEFNSDSAYQYVQDQVDFGPRVPNTDAHNECAKYLVSTMERFGAKVIVQKAKVKAYDETVLNIQNIISSFRPEVKRRVLLFAHWDSRPVADHCESPELRDNPILGANDGASGVGVLMEVGRQLGITNPNIGVDIIFFDAEDYGTPDHLDLPYKEDTWCLGSQYWSNNMHELGYFPMYGVLLDMVGAKNALFYKEQVSMYFAPDIVRKVWGTASKLGYSNYFIDMDGGQVIDDHLYVNKIARIPSIDIIQHDPTTDSKFGSFWHTHDDNMDVIDKETLKAVGQTLTAVIFYEK